MKSLILKGIYKSYGALEVLKDFSLEVMEGEHVVLMGESGKGKTTLLNIIMDFESSDAGAVQVGGEISAMFQEDRLSEGFTALSNVCLLKNSRKEGEILLKKLEIESKKRVEEMSGGQKRRVALARALLNPAALFIFDEPLKGLDEGTKAMTMEVIEEYTKGKSAIFVTHDISEGKTYGDRIIRLQ